MPIQSDRPGNGYPLSRWRSQWDFRSNDLGTDLADDYRDTAHKESTVQSAEQWEATTNPIHLIESVKGLPAKRICLALAERWTLLLSGLLLDHIREMINHVRRSLVLTTEREVRIAQLAYQHRTNLPFSHAIFYCYRANRLDFIQTYHAVRDTIPAEDRAKEDALTCNYLREIIPNPHYPIILRFEWFTDTVNDLAYAILDEARVFEMPILADALEDAGCNCHTLLHHLRTPLTANVPMSDNEREQFPMHLNDTWMMNTILTRCRKPTLKWLKNSTTHR